MFIVIAQCISSQSCSLRTFLVCAGAVQACSAGAAPCAVILINPGGSGGRGRGVGEALIKLTIIPLPLHEKKMGQQFSSTSPGQNNWGIGRKTQNEFFRGLLAPWGFGEHPKTHTFLESTRPEVNETAIKISNFGRYPQFRRPSNFGPPSGAILTPTCARAWEAHAGCVSKPPGGLWRG